MTKKMRYKVTPAVWLCLFRTKDNGEIEVLLQKRQNTGYMDNRYDLSVSGHLEPGENASQAVVRGAKEEIGIEVALEDLEFSNASRCSRRRISEIIFYHQTMERHASDHGA